MKSPIGFALLAAVLAWTPPAAAQPAARAARIGVLLYSNPETDPTLAGLRQGLRDLGYREGQTLTIDYRSGEGRPERLPMLAAELVGQKPDILVAIGGDVTPALQRATATIPIIAWVSNDPVQAGFAASLSRPGRNITGVTLILDALAGKRLALLKEVAPRVTRVGIVWNPEHADPEFRECRRAAQALGITLQSLEVRHAADFDTAFQTALRERSETLIAVWSRLVDLHRRRLIEFAAQELVVNTGAARSLGLAIPESVLVRADRVIE